jgi:hypothetical protein
LQNLKSTGLAIAIVTIAEEIAQHLLLHFLAYHLRVFLGMSMEKIENPSTSSLHQASDDFSAIIAVHQWRFKLSITREKLRFMQLL